MYCPCGAGCNLSPEQISAISALVAKRSKAKAATDYACADEIFNLLLREYGINIDNRAGNWALVHKEFNPNVLSFVPNENVIMAIGKKLGKRILVRKRRDFDLAEKVHNELCNGYIMEINNKKGVNGGGTLGQTVVE